MFGVSVALKRWTPPGRKQELEKRSGLPCGSLTLGDILRPNARGDKHHTAPLPYPQRLSFYIEKFKLIFEVLMIDILS